MKRIWSAALLLALVAVAFLAGVWSVARLRAGAATGTRKALYWVDPMHPTYKSDKPGIAPDCGMALEPVYAGDADARAAARPCPPGALRVSPEKQQTIGVRVGPVETSAVTRTIRTVGRVAVDENRVYRLVATVDGIVRELQSERRRQLRPTGPGPPHLLQLGVPRGAAGATSTP